MFFVIFFPPIKLFAQGFSLILSEKKQHFSERHKNTLSALIAAAPSESAPTLAD